MTKITTFAAASLFAALTAGAANAQSAPAADPHAGHVMPAASPQAAPSADPHAGHSMPAAAPQTAPVTDPHAGHDMSAMSGQTASGQMAVPAPTGTALQASSPAAGAMLNGSPAEISLTLPHAMVVKSVSLTNAAGQRFPLSATLSETAVESVTTPVPTLPAGSYTVAWTAAGTNHTMTGTFGFMVH